MLDDLTRTAYLLKWHGRFGPASGSDRKIRDALGRYVLTAFAHGTLPGSRPESDVVQRRPPLESVGVALAGPTGRSGTPSA
ncbi:hypothetical protein ABZ914_03950 [Spirillospora sp. NPDC046719]